MYDLNCVAKIDAAKVQIDILLRYKIEKKIRNRGNEIHKTDMTLTIILKVKKIPIYF